MTEQIMPALLTASQVAQLLGLDRSTVYRSHLLHKIPSVRIPGVDTVRYPRAGVDAFIAAHTITTKEDEQRIRDRRRS